MPATATPVVTAGKPKARRTRTPAPAASTPVAVIAAPVPAPAKKFVRQTRNDPVEVLVKSITDGLPKIKGQATFKDALWKRMLEAKDANQSKGDRYKLIAIIREMSAMKRRLLAMSEVTESWDEALLSAVEFVRSENALDRFGQVQFDLALRSDFAEAKARIDNMIRMKDSDFGVADKNALCFDLVGLAFETTNYVWDGKFCKTCHTPISSQWDYCGDCHHSYAATHPRKADAVDEDESMAAPTHVPPGLRKKQDRHRERREDRKLKGPQGSGKSRKGKGKGDGKSSRKGRQTSEGD